MRILLAGASGLIGTALTRRLKESGHQTRRLVRRPARGEDERQWDPAAQELDPGHLDGVDALINLSGAGIANRPWTRTHIERLYASRLNSTNTLVVAMNSAPRPPTIFVSQSVSGYYGDCGDNILTEASPSGSLIVSDIARKWEVAAQAAPAGTRVVTPRTGIVLSPHGGAAGKLLMPIRVGAGGPLGSGRQWWPWISLPDETRALEFVLTAELEGPVNLCAPDPARVSRLVGRLAAALGKPSKLRVPEAVLTMALGRLAKELLLPSARMDPGKLLAAGFTFDQPTVDDAVAWIAASLQ